MLTRVMVVHLHCQPDRTYSHHGNIPLGVSREAFLARFKEMRHTLNGSSTILWTGVLNFTKDEPSTDTSVSLLLDICFLVLTLHPCLDGPYPLKLQVHTSPLLFSCRALGEKSNWCKALLRSLPCLRKLLPFEETWDAALGQAALRMLGPGP